MSNANCVLVEEKLYVGGGYADVYDSKVFMSSPNFLEWTQLEILHGTKHFALTTYKSQLVLVGGKITAPAQNAVTNKLWIRNTLLNKWEEFLPPMQIERYWPSAINLGSPEALVVAGGRGKEGKELDSVEILLGGEWSTVKSLPKRCYGIKAIIYNERLYLAGGNRQGRNVFCCKVASITDKEVAQSDSLWSQFTAIPLEAAYMACFQHELVAVTKKVFAYQSFAKCWVHVGDTPKDIRVETIPINVPSGDLVVIGTSTKKSKLFKISMKGM